MNNKKVPKESWIALLFLWLIFAMNANGRNIISVLLTYISDEFNLSPDVAGYLSSVAFAGIAIASIPGANWADKRGHGWARKKTNLIFAAVYLVFTFICGINAITVSFGVLLGLQFIRGLGSGAGDAVEVGTVAEWFPKEKVAGALGIHHTSYPWGCAIGGVILTFFLKKVGDANWQYAFFIFPIIAIFIWIAYYLWATPAKYKSFEEKTIAAGMTPPLQENAENAAPAKGFLGRLIKNPNVTASAAVAFLCHIGYIGMSFWLPLYLAYVAGFDYSVVASLSIVYTITGGLGQIFWGSVADKIGTKKVLLICCAWLTVAYFLMQYANMGLGVYIALQLFWGCCSNGVYPVFYGFTGRCIEPGTTASANGVVNFGLYLGAMVATPIVGTMIKIGGGYQSFAGYQLALYVMVAAQAAAFVIMLLFTRETNGKRKGRDFSLVSTKSCNIDMKEE